MSFRHQDTLVDSLAGNSSSVHRIDATPFLEAAQEDVYSPVWMIALTTGMRRGELLGIRWKDIDLARATLTVQQCVSLLHDVPVIHQPKTASQPPHAATSPSGRRRAQGT